MNDGDGTGAESVTLTGSATDSDGSVVSYEWIEGGTVLGTTATLTTTLTVGVHNLTLHATDNEGAVGTDTVVVTVLANQGPTANAGNDMTVVDMNNSGSEVVALSGSGVDPDGTITGYLWMEGSTVLGTTPSISPSLSVGSHLLTLTVTDNGGATSSDTVNVTVLPAPSEVVLFEDSFEIGNNSNDWNGKWVEDSQNDFFRNTQRATDGIRSAEVDGYAGNATLNLSTPIDISGYASSVLTFDWLIGSGFDTGESLSLDVSTNGGSSWTENVRQLKGNSSPENTWLSETVDLTPYASTSLLIRFRALVSSSREDANIDNVKIIGSNPNSSGMLAYPLSGASSDSTLSELTVVEVPSSVEQASRTSNRLENSVSSNSIALPPIVQSMIHGPSADAVDSALLADDLLDSLDLDLLTGV